VALVSPVGEPETRWTIAPRRNGRPRMTPATLTKFVPGSPSPTGGCTRVRWANRAQYHKQR
jgi:hypothetical protein